MDSVNGIILTCKWTENNNSNFECFVFHSVLGQSLRRQAVRPPLTDLELQLQGTMQDLAGTLEDLLDVRSRPPAMSKDISQS